MRGHVTNELDVPLPADDVWAVYGSPDLPRMITYLEPGVFEKLDIVEGDGGEGTVIHIVLAPGNGGPRAWEEKFVEINHKTRTKVARQINGGFLDIGFTLYQDVFKVIEKDANSCIIQSTVAYDVEEKFEANASLITADSLWGMAKAIANYAIQKKGHSGEN